MADIEIERLSLNTSPGARLNAYNRHSLAPWLAETGYLTPMYLYRREQERLPFNMSRWITQRIADTMLKQPSAVVTLDKQSVRCLLEVAAACYFDVANAQNAYHKRQLDQIAIGLPILPHRKAGYFVRLSESSPKDVDDGNLQAVHSVAEALLKLVYSKRAVQALLAVYDAGDEKTDNMLYFFPYLSTIDRLSEWRCYIHEGNVVAISQSRFYQPYHAGVTDEALRQMVKQVRRLWDTISPELNFASCALDVYAEVHRPGFEAKLIEINPYGPHCGSGSLLFHWMDDKHILCPPEPTNRTVLRLLQHGGAENATPSGRKEAYNIGRAGIIEDELKVLHQRGLTWLLEPEHHTALMSLPVPGNRAGVTTRKAGLERFRRENARRIGIDRPIEPLVDERVENHPRFRKLQDAYKASTETVQISRELGS